MSVFQKYAAYYDLLYRDKDYAGEVDYIDGLIRKFQPEAKTILDLGCGTGRHAGLLAQKGYRVHGIDLSKEMLAEAQKLTSDNLCFSYGDVRTVRLETIFDVVVSLFHVMSYQTANRDLEQAFQTVAEHLKSDGVFIFDCWYGPAVLTDRPSVRVKRLENEALSVVRIADPLMHANEDIVDVNYQVFIKDKKADAVEEINESHRMRYLFTPELKLLLSLNGLEIIDSFEFMTGHSLGYGTWNGCFVAKRYQ